MFQHHTIPPLPLFSHPPPVASVLLLPGFHNEPDWIVQQLQLDPNAYREKPVKRRCGGKWRLKQVIYTSWESKGTPPQATSPQQKQKAWLTVYHNNALKKAYGGGWHLGGYP